jgi:tight adherence protein B
MKRVAKTSSITQETTDRRTSSFRATRRQMIYTSAGAILTFAIFHNLVLTLIFAIALGALPESIRRRKLERDRIEFATLWPEILDHIISGLRSGLSLAETLAGLSERGPIQTRSTFLRCEQVLRDSGDFDQAFRVIKERFHDPLADQVCEVLNFARGTGSRDTAITLRTLADFIRSDIALRAEIRSKHGWIKNSAMIAAAAPWILLLILSTQANTVSAFSTPAGVTVLFVGVGMSFLAYLWMGRAGRLPEVPRIFQ